MIPVGVVLKFLRSLDPLDDEVVDFTKIIDPCFPGHKNILSPPPPYQLIILWTSLLPPPIQVSDNRFIRVISQSFFPDNASSKQQHFYKS